MAPPAWDRAGEHNDTKVRREIHADWGYQMQRAADPEQVSENRLV
jgi:hypothetical protein